LPATLKSLKVEDEGAVGKIPDGPVGIPFIKQSTDPVVNLNDTWFKPVAGKFLPKLPSKDPYPIEDVVETTATVPSWVNRVETSLVCPAKIIVRFP
jgi:hypothetical protein